MRAFESFAEMDTDGTVAVSYTHLPAINNNLGAAGDRVRDDLYTTMTELMSENHMGALQTWAKTHNMTVRYQAYSSAGSSMFELTYPALNIDIVEACLLYTSRCV